MNKNLLLIAAGAVGAVMVLNRVAAQAAPVGGVRTSSALPTKNVNDQLWTSLLGGAWTSVRDATNPDGTAAFLKRNWLGQTVTSTGLPISEVLEESLPVTYGNFIDVALGEGGDGKDYLTSLGW